MSESPLAIGISVLALTVSIITLWFNRLRGPSIKPVKSDEEGKTIIQEEVNTPLHLERLPFNLRVTLANNSGNAGIIRSPKISFTSDPSFNANSEIKIEAMSLEPATSRSTGFLHKRDNSYTVPPFSVRVASFECSFQLMKWDDAPMDHFVKGCNLKQIQLDYFEFNKKKLNELLSELALKNKLGIIEITLMVTEKSFPVFGLIKWKERKFLTDHELRISEDSISRLRQKLQDWKQDINRIRDLYQNFLNYVENQSRHIVKTMEKKFLNPIPLSLTIHSTTMQVKPYLERIQSSQICGLKCAITRKPTK